MHSPSQATLSLRVLSVTLALGIAFTACRTTHKTEHASTSATTAQSEPVDPDRPSPPVPEDALILGDWGNLELLISADRAGLITDVKIAKPSAVKILDDHTRTWVQQHWKMPPATAREPDVRQFVAPIIYPKLAYPKGGRYPPPNYPSPALHKRIEGVVALRLHVDETGHVDAISLLKSSGSQILDDHTCSHVRQRWRFPAGKARLVWWTCIYKME
jgi:TonB family protein